MSNDIVKSEFSLMPTSFAEAERFAKIIADSDLAPKDYKGKPGNVLIAMQWGSELGIKPLQALQSIAVINGRPSIWGDALIAIAQNHPDCEWIKETDDGHTATCTVKRKNHEPHTVSFSMDDAKKAGLSDKQGPWSQYPARMRQMRARAFALRDKFSDALKGFQCVEESIDLPPEKEITVLDDITAKLSAPKVEIKTIEQPQASTETINQETGEITPPKLDAVIESINACTNISDLETLIDAASLLSSADKLLARKTYAAKLKELKLREVKEPDNKSDLDESWEEFQNEKENG